MISTLDEKDRLLLSHLQNNARMTNAELGSLVSLSPSGVQKRLRKLEEQGLIAQYATILSRRQLGYDLAVFVQITLQDHAPEAVAEFDAAIQTMTAVLEAHRVTGSADYLLKVVVPNHQHLDHFLMNELVALPAVGRVSSSLVLKSVKETTNIGLLDTRVESESER